MTHFSYKPSPEKVAALKALRGHLKEIAASYRGVWFKADLIHGGVMIRLFERKTWEVMIARCDQPDTLLDDVYKPDFRERLLDELIRTGFPIEKDKVSL